MKFLLALRHPLYEYFCIIPKRYIPAITNRLHTHALRATTRPTQAESTPEDYFTERGIVFGKNRNKAEIRRILAAEDMLT